MSKMVNRSSRGVPSGGIVAGRGRVESLAACAGNPRAELMTFPSAYSR
jgi:hypothetical protein